jgi:hypothetical protein
MSATGSSVPWIHNGEVVQPRCRLFRDHLLASFNQLCGIALALIGQRLHAH